MRPLTLFVLLALALPAFAQQGSAPPLATTQPPPAWAYVVNPPNAPDEPSGTELQHVPNSTQAYSFSQIQDLFAVPDWHPDAHPAMPDIVAHGRRPDVYACAYCHLPNGLGRPENASLAGLSAPYIAQQMDAFKSGKRQSAEPKSLPANAMHAVAAHATLAEGASAAVYFSSLKPQPWIKVIETSTVPRTHIYGWMLVPDQPVKQEPIGRRLIEVPVNPNLTELRDDTSGFLAYVPKGSLKRGKSLVEKGANGLTLPCATCHGSDLRGKDDVPPIAGRSPSYIVRQLYDLQLGTRAGAASAQMQLPVLKLSLEDMIALAAYLATLRP